MPDVDTIITRLRAGAFENDPNAHPNVALPDAEAAVVAAVDARTAEIEEALAAAYREAPLVIARLCDEHLDRRGALLGRVRTIARRFPNGGTNDGT